MSTVKKREEGSITLPSYLNSTPCIFIPRAIIVCRLRLTSLPPSKPQLRTAMATVKLSFVPVVKPFPARNSAVNNQSIFGYPTSPASGIIKERNIVLIEGRKLSSKWVVLNASPGSSSSISVEDDDGVSLGTMKLPGNTDLTRFETLLFQWGNSLCQGANLPLPLPLKVDKIPGGARLGFIKIEDGKTEVPVYIDCLVFPATETEGPMFRAIRNGPLKAEAPPGEPRIMRSLLGALQKSIEIARL